MRGLIYRPLVALFLGVAITSFIATAALANWVKTPGVPVPIGSNPPLASTGGLPSQSLFLRGKLGYANGSYTIAVDALPGYVVPLSFITPDLQSWAAAHLGQEVVVVGNWDRNNPKVFVVQ